LNLRNWLGALAPSDEASQLVATIAGIRTVTIGARRGMIGYRKAANVVRMAGVRQPVSQAADSLLAVQDRAIENFITLIAFLTGWLIGPPDGAVRRAPLSFNRHVAFRFQSVCGGPASNM
jgi:hypothetical protein